MHQQLISFHQSPVQLATVTELGMITSECEFNGSVNRGRDSVVCPARVTIGVPRSCTANQKCAIAECLVAAAGSQRGTIPGPGDAWFGISVYLAMQERLMAWFNHDCVWSWQDANGN